MMQILEDGMLEPFGIQLSRESQMDLMVSSTSTEESEYSDGDIDFGSTFDNKEYQIKGIVEHEPGERDNVVNGLTALFLQCMEKQELIDEKNPDVMTYARLTGKPNFTFYPTWMDISFTMKLDSFWYGAEEKTLIGGGIATNAGSHEAMPTIEIAGPATNPSLTIGDKTLTYTGIVPSGQTLIIQVIEENAGTAKIGSQNAMAGYNGAFPSLPPGETTVTAGANATISWRDTYL